MFFGCGNNNIDYAESISMEIGDLGSMLGSFNMAQDASRESGKASKSVSHEDDADDDTIMMRGNIWSTEVSFSLFYCVFPLRQIDSFH
jgi:hypothetical protein